MPWKKLFLWTQIFLRTLPQLFANAILFARNSAVFCKFNYICAQFHSNLKAHLYLRAIPQHLANAMIIATDCTLTCKCNITQNMDVISNPAVGTWKPVLMLQFYRSSYCAGKFLNLTIPYVNLLSSWSSILMLKIYWKSLFVWENSWMEACGFAQKKICGSK